MPPENMAISMRHSKMTAEDAAILAGEVEKPTWASRNEGIHERVSFEDSIWGFDLAGGSYYKTPLRVTYVKPDSRAEKAGIRPGDRLKRINDIDTSTLTIQEAHEIIIESGVHLKLAVTAPEDEEDAYYCYEDPLDQSGYDSEEERRREAERAKKRQVHARVSHYWSLQWPWVSKRRVIYRESNCFMVPSKFEDKNKSKFPTQPMLKTQEDIVLDSIQSELDKKKKFSPTPITNGTANFEEILNKNPSVANSLENKTLMVNGNENLIANQNNELLNGKQWIPDIEEPSLEEQSNTLQEDLTEDISQSEEVVESKEEYSMNEVSTSESYSEKESKNDTMETFDGVDDSQVESSNVENTETNEYVNDCQQHEDDIFDQMLEGDDSVSKTEEEYMFESILSESEDQMNSTTDKR